MAIIKGMDEILIEEKKYVSSRQAAKITGYAKDYIGQLCREGRVPARLVGRSWYVLESAIHDHRFGVEVEEKQRQTVQSPAYGVKSTLSHWESPRYETAQPEFLPYMSHREEIVAEEIEEGVAVDDTKSLHESWREWFDHIADAAGAPVSETEAVVSVVEAVEETEALSEEVKVPLRVMSSRPEREPLPDIVRIQPRIEHREASRGAGRLVERSMQMVAAISVVVAVVLAVAGSGYFDEYLISNSQAHIISGITVYNK